MKRRFCAVPVLDGRNGTEEVLEKVSVALIEWLKSGQDPQRIICKVSQNYRISSQNKVHNDWLTFVWIVSGKYVKGEETESDKTGLTDWKDRQTTERDRHVNMNAIMHLHLYTHMHGCTQILSCRLIPCRSQTLDWSASGQGHEVGMVV